MRVKGSQKTSEDVEAGSPAEEQARRDFCVSSCGFKQADCLRPRRAESDETLDSLFGDAVREASRGCWLSGRRGCGRRGGRADALRVGRGVGRLAEGAAGTREGRSGCRGGGAGRRCRRTGSGAGVAEGRVDGSDRNGVAVAMARKGTSGDC